MDQDLVPITGPALIFLISAIGNYFNPTATRAFCDLLYTTGSWILGSFALMAVSQATTWVAEDIDIFIEPQNAALSIAILTDFLVRNGFLLDRFIEHDYNYGNCDTLTFIRRTELHVTLKIQLVLNKYTPCRVHPFPLFVLRRFDLSCCCCGFNGVQLFKAAWNILPFCYTQHDRVRRYRIRKYITRGFHMCTRRSTESPQLAPNMTARQTCPVVVRRTRAMVYTCDQKLINGLCPHHK